MNDDRNGEQLGDATSSSEPQNVKESPVSGAVPAPDEQDALSLQAAASNLELPTSRGDAASMPDAGGGGSSVPAEFVSDSQFPDTEAKPIAPAAAPARNATAEVHDPRHDGSSEGSNKVDTNNNTKDSSSAPHPDPPIVPKVKIHLVAVGSAPILKRTKFQIGA
jgi:hypothetical protein